MCSFTSPQISHKQGKKTFILLSWQENCDLAESCVVRFPTQFPAIPSHASAKGFLLWCSAKLWALVKTQYHLGKEWESEWKLRCCFDHADMGCPITERNGLSKQSGQTPDGRRWREHGTLLVGRQSYRSAPLLLRALKMFHISLL